MKLGAKLGLLTDFLLGGNGWKPPIESTLRTLDTLVQLNAQGFANAPPSANDGDTFIVGPAPGGAFAGQPTGTVARYHSATGGATFNGWQFDSPREGWWGSIGGAFYEYRNGAWARYDGKFVLRAGDVMTGPLVSPGIVLRGAYLGQAQYNGKSENDPPSSYAPGLTFGVNMLPASGILINGRNQSGSFETVQNGFDPQLTYQKFFHIGYSASIVTVAGMSIRGCRPGVDQWGSWVYLGGI